MTSLVDVSSDATIAEITFVAIGENGDRSDIEVLTPTVANSAGQEVDITVINGWVAISTVRMGDVNGDGNCNAIDALMSLQCDVGLVNATCIQP